MIKKIILTSILYVAFISTSFSAGSSDTGSKNALYDKAVNLINVAKKMEEKGKLEKAKKKYQKANDYLHEANKKDPLKPDILNYLGFTTRKLGDNENAEIYYLLGLKQNPNHNGINEYLGELYLATDRPEKAKERLLVLKNCNCEEYNELKALIEGIKKSKY